MKTKMPLDLGYKIVVWKFFVAQTQAKQLQFLTIMPTTKPTHLLLLLLPPRPAAAAAAASSPNCCCCWYSVYCYHYTSCNLYLDFSVAVLLR
jgi:hypothetical protein